MAYAAMTEKVSQGTLKHDRKEDNLSLVKGRLQMTEQIRLQILARSDDKLGDMGPRLYVSQHLVAERTPHHIVATCITRMTHTHT